MSTRERAFVAAVTATVLVGAFGLGAAGFPGTWVAAAVEWALSEGFLVVGGTAGEALQAAMG